MSIITVNCVVKSCRKDKSDLSKYFCEEHGCVFHEKCDQPKRADSDLCYMHVCEHGACENPKIGKVKNPIGHVNVCIDHVCKKCKRKPACKYCFKPEYCSAECAA